MGPLACRNRWALTWRHDVNRRALYFRWVRFSRYNLLYPLFWCAICLAGMGFLMWFMTGG